MTVHAAKVRKARKMRWIVTIGVFGLLAAGRAYAQTSGCSVDTDCPGTGCGGQVCNMSSGGAQCQDPNTAHTSGFDDGRCSGSDGASDMNCKCRAEGAKCMGLNCTFTVPQDGGTTGTGGSGTGTGGSGTGTGGSGTGKGGTSGGGGGGGCSVAGAPTALGWGVTLLLALAFVRRRRR